jgi:hypothetical protein
MDYGCSEGNFLIFASVDPCKKVQAFAIPNFLQFLRNQTFQIIWLNKWAHKYLQEKVTVHQDYLSVSIAIHSPQCIMGLGIFILENRENKLDKSLGVTLRTYFITYRCACFCNTSCAFVLECTQKTHLLCKHA